MKKSFQIFKRDIGRLSKNIVALIVVIGVCIIPSLYAWFNIAANKDPYGNTANIKIAVANNDAGTENDMLGNLDVGGQIVDTLKENDSLGWVFVSEDKAISGVKSGEYYAAIVIPDNFSESMVSFLSGKIEQPEFDYYLNEKKNAIAPKITDTGANTIQQQVNTEFVSAAAGTVADILNGSVSGIGTKLDDVQNDISTKISTVSDNLKEYEKALDSFNKTVDSSNKLIEKSKKSMAIVKSDANSGVNSIKNGTDSLTLVRNDIADFANDLGAGISKAQNSLAKVNTKSGINLGKISSKTESIHGQFQEMITSVESIIDKNSEMLITLKEINKKYPSDSLTNLINELDSQNSKYKTILQKLRTGSDSINDATTTSVKAVESISKIIEKNTKDIHSSKITVENGIMTGLNTSLDTFSNIQGTLSGILKGVGPATDNVVTLMDQLENSLDSAKKALSSTGSSIKKVQERLDKANVDISVVKTSKIYIKLKDMTNLDSDKVASFMSSPVKLKTETFYSVENYGTAMTPFYTNLAIWVGGIVLIAIFKMEVDKSEKIKNFTPTQAYFGRWMLFILVGFVQALIICLGDIFILKIKCQHPVLFVVAGLVAAFVYVNLIYALSLTFKHIGKAVSVILVILQIPGSAGTYPIEMTPGFFQAIHPLLPFTYGINAMREAIAGTYGHYYVKNLVILLIYVPIALFIGLVLRRLLLNLNSLFDKKLEQTGLMICEEEGITRERVRLLTTVKILAGEKQFRDEINKKVEQFEICYPKLIKGGFFAIVIIPIVFLILMFSITSKMVFLVLWIVSIILIALYLICVEFIHENLLNKQKMAEMTGDELIEQLKKRGRKNSKEGDED
ncbi:YhgE/Pip domain-containing protein [Eubacterium ventriosum]|uniref:YhgE/Pip domain-containing protein n=1 Tax=Eubacterium ventriosum TaxID=39496 RepID=UPI0032C1BB28